MLKQHSCKGDNLGIFMSEAGNKWAGGCWQCSGLVEELEEPVYGTQDHNKLVQDNTHVF